VGGACHVAINEGVAPYPSSLCPGFFARASTKGNDFPWGSIIIIIITTIIIIIIIIIIDHVTLLTCWECRFTYFI